MRVLSVDPGYERLGIAIVEKVKGTETLVYSDCLQTDKSFPYEERLHQLGEKIEEVIQKFKPEIFASESLFFTKNQKTAIDVAGVRGMLFYISKKYKLTLFEYTPLQIKIAVTGYGKSDKKQVMAMLTRLIKIEKKIKLDDEYDAIAVGLTCLASERF